MIEVMIELHLAHARLETVGSLPAGLRDSIMTAYGIDSAEYMRTLAYYADRPSKYSEIYGQVLDRMNLERLGREDALEDPTLRENGTLDRLRPR